MKHRPVNREEVVDELGGVKRHDDGAGGTGTAAGAALAPCCRCRLGAAAPSQVVAGQHPPDSAVVQALERIVGAAPPLLQRDVAARAEGERETAEVGRLQQRGRPRTHTR